MATPKQTDPQFKLRMTPAIKDAIEAAASANKRSMNAEILARLELSFSSSPSEELQTMKSKIALLEGVITGLDSSLKIFTEYLQRAVGDNVVSIDDLKTTLNTLRHDSSTDTPTKADE